MWIWVDNWVFPSILKLCFHCSSASPRMGGWLSMKGLRYVCIECGPALNEIKFEFLHILQSSGNGIVGAIFLVTFITIGAFIFANLVVADLVANLVCVVWRYLFLYLFVLSATGEQMPVVVRTYIGTGNFRAKQAGWKALQKWKKWRYWKCGIHWCNSNSHGIKIWATSIWNSR